MSLEAAQIVLRPVISEKSMDESQRGKYTFAVHEDASKIQIEVLSRPVVCANSVYSQSERIASLFGTHRGWQFL